MDLNSKNYYCSICEQEFDELEALGSLIRKNVLCIQCKSVERQMLLSMFGKEKTNLFLSVRPFKVLHFAPEIRIHANFFGQKTSRSFKRREQSLRDLELACSQVT